MTGIERLRDIVNDGPYSGGMIHISVQKLREICEQIEREADVETVKAEAIRAADNRRVELCAALGIDTDTGWSDAMAEMVKRLMPEGMSWLLEVWPKWSNGEYCKFGDWWTADKYGDYEPRQLRRLVFYTPEQLREWEQDEGDNFGYEWDFMRPSDPKYRPDKVEPPAPKVLDADGVEIRVGDHVWNEFGTAFTITGVNGKNKSFKAMRHYDGQECDGCNPTIFTHRSPVLAADGEPLEVGQTVYHIADGKEYTVKKLFKAGAMVTPDGITGGRCRAEYLTHERPDTWERIEEDCAKSDVDYCAERGLLDPSCDTVEGDASTRHCTDCGCTCGEKMARDIVRRCRALAERERGE